MAENRGCLTRIRKNVHVVLERVFKKTELHGQRDRGVKWDGIFQGMENWFVWLELKVT